VFFDAFLKLSAMTTQKVRVAIHFIMSGNRAYNLVMCKKMFQPFQFQLVFSPHSEFVSSSGMEKNAINVDVFLLLFFKTLNFIFESTINL